MGALIAAAWSALGAWRRGGPAAGLGLACGLVGLLLAGLAETALGARTTPLFATMVAMAGLMGRERE